MKIEGKVTDIEGKTVRLAYLDSHQNKVEDTLQVWNETEEFFVNDHADSFFTLELIANSRQQHKKKMQLYSSLGPVLKSSIFGKRVLEDLKVSGRGESGQKILSFTRNDMNGKPVSIEYFKGKYVLIDF